MSELPHGHLSDSQWQTIISDFRKRVSSSSAESELPGYPAPDQKEFRKTIDHTLLKLDARQEQFDQICIEAKDQQFATVCVRPEWVRRCRDALEGSDVKVASVVGFHEGTYTQEQKLNDLRISLSSGASELDIVLNYVQLQKRSYATIYAELATLRKNAPHPVLLKLIFETSQLTQDEIVAACVLANAAQYDFVKTSTGFNGPGAKIEDVGLMRLCCELLAQDPGESVQAGITPNRQMQVKASGGIRTLQDAVNMFKAGASRLGTSAGMLIIAQATAGGDGDAGLPQKVSSETQTDY